MPPSAAMDERWVDILPPELPLSSLAPGLLGLAGVALLALIVTLAIYYRHPRQRAKRRLRRVARDLERATIAPKSAYFHVRRCLREYLGTRVGPSLHWLDTSPQAWPNFWRRLTEHCFAAPNSSVAEARRCVEEAMAWLDKRRVDS